MKSKKALKYLGISSLIGVSVSTLCIPVVSCSSISLELKDNELTQLWTKVNNFIINNKVTVATNKKDANFDQFLTKIVSEIKKSKFSNFSMNEYFDGNIEQNLANISFQLNNNGKTVKCTPRNLYDGYIVVETNGKIHLNNLALSSPDKYFIFENDNKTILKGTTLIGQNEPNILIPYGVVTISQGALPYPKKIKNMIIADTVKTLPSYFLQKCYSLEYVKLSRSITELPLQAFTYSTLKKIDWYEGLVNIGKFAFYSTKLSGDIVLPKSVAVLNSQSFQFSLDTDNSVHENYQPEITSITTWCDDFGTYVFYKQQGIKRINLMRDSIRWIDRNAFVGLPSTTKIYVKNGVIRQKIIDSCITNNTNKATITKEQIIVDPNL